MTQRIVDDLEVIEIKICHRKQPLAPPRMQYRLLKAVQNKGAVGQACQRIVTGLVAQKVLLTLARRNVAGNNQHGNNPVFHIPLGHHAHMKMAWTRWLQIDIALQHRCLAMLKHLLHDALPRRGCRHRQSQFTPGPAQTVHRIPSR